MTDDIDRIVRGLSKAQREALTLSQQARVTPRLFYSQTLTSLDSRGLIDAQCYITPHGIAVRNRILESGDGK